MFKFKYAVIGGTFDHLHAGHKVLLKRAIELAEHIDIGVTCDEYVQTADKKFKELIQPCRERICKIQHYLAEIDYVHGAKVNEVDGSYADTLDSKYDVFLTSDEESSLKTAEAVNKLREAKGLAKLAVEVIDVGTHTVCPDGERISSTRIRRYLKYHGDKV